MKSERRHNLKTNELAKGLQKLPELTKKYGSRALTALIVLLLVILILQYRAHTQRVALNTARQNLAGAYNMLTELRSPDPLTMHDMNEFALRRKLAVQNAQSAIDAVLSGTDNKQLLASALAARGNLNWLIATLPTVPAATTQPSLALDTPRDQALTEAKSSYEEVLKTYPTFTIQANSARFGLAAIAEQNHEWGTAEQMYDAIQQDSNAPVSLKTLAAARKLILDQIKQPMYLAPASTASESATNITNGTPVDLPTDLTAPLVQAPTTAPAATTQPADESVTPTTAPSAIP